MVHSLHAKHHTASLSLWKVTFYEEKDHFFFSYDENKAHHALLFRYTSIAVKTQNVELTFLTVDTS